MLTDNIFETLGASINSVTGKLNSQQVPFNINVHTERLRCKVTFRSKSNNRLLYTIDILNWNKKEINNSENFTPVNQNNSERSLYRLIMREFSTLVNKYFESTGIARKDALLRIIRQIQLLIKATSTPALFSEYEGSEQPNKTKRMIEDIAKYDEKIAIGNVTIDALEYYTGLIQHNYPNRPLFIVKGDIPFKKREPIINEFQASKNGILISTQQSLKSSVNIPECNKVFIESLQWNIPTIEQYYFRFIRYDSTQHTDVYFYNYHDTIETNLLALLMAKEKLNDYIKTLEYRDNSDIYSEYDIDPNILNMLISKEKDEDGKIQLRWGQGSLC